MKAKIEAKALARSMYLEGKTYNEIMFILQVSKGSVSLWCSDLAAERRANSDKNYPIRPAKGMPTKEPVPRSKRVRTKKIRDTTVGNYSAKVSIKRGVEAEYPYLGYKFYSSLGEDGVGRVTLHKNKHDIIGMSLARYIMSVHLGRILEKHEIVKHIHGKSDEISNLEIVTRVILKERFQASLTKPCVICGEIFTAKVSRVKSCSSQCAHQLKLKNLSNEKKQFQHTCQECNREFVSYSDKSVTCSDRCRQDRRAKNRQNEKAYKNRIYTPPQRSRKTQSIKQLNPYVVKEKRLIREKFTHECVICENEFQTYDKNSEVCLREKCIDTMIKYANS